MFLKFAKMDFLISLGVLYYMLSVLHGFNILVKGCNSYNWLVSDVKTALSLCIKMSIPGACWLIEFIIIIISSLSQQLFQNVYLLHRTEVWYTHIYVNHLLRSLLIASISLKHGFSNTRLDLKIHYEFSMLRNWKLRKFDILWFMVNCRYFLIVMTFNAADLFWIQISVWIS